ncbi:MAG: ribosome maturation factor RimM [Bilophila sp.]
MKDGLVTIGTLARPHGIKGEIRVNYYAESPHLLRGEVYLQAGNAPPRKMEVETMRMHQGTPLVRFVTVPDRTAAELLRGQEILVPEAELPEPDEDEVYLHDMLGLSVFLDATGESLGTLDHVLFHGEQEVWAIRTPDGKELLLPAVPEFVAEIDLEAECIRITPPEGLLELYLG